MTGTSTAATSAAPCRVAIAGASGRMGRMLIEAVQASGDCVLAGAQPAAPLGGVGALAGGCGRLGQAGRVRGLGGVDDAGDLLGGRDLL